MSWMPPKHDLLSPITGDDGSQIESIQLKPLFYAAQKEALERAGDDEDDQFFELALLATGMSVKELDQLKRPDYVSIAQYVHEMSTRPASYFLDQVEDAETSDDPDQVQLLQPLAVTGRTVTSLSLEMPALRATKVMKKLKTAKERAEFITAHCTGLMIPDLALLSVPDWTQLQVRIDDFLNQPAAFFSERDIEVILDIVPLIYPVSEAEILEWDAEKALRRYDIAITRLGVKQE